MGLYAASALITFLLQATVEWTGCLLLVRIIRSPNARFRLWLTLFLVVFVQWAWLWLGIVHRALPTTVVGLSHTPSVTSWGHSLILSPVWENRAAALLIALAVSYGVVLCGLMVLAAWMRIRLKKALRYTVAPSERLSRIFHEVSLLIPSHHCQLWVLPGLASPATFGWRHPRVIVPFECEHLDHADLEAIFRHELTHVQRRDALWNAIVRGCRNLLWFHPCIHHAFRAISVERELACDRVVVEEYPVGRDAYAACLLRFARLNASSDRAIPCIELTSGAAFLNLRVRSILAETPAATFISTLRRATAGFVLVSALSALTPGLRIWLTSVQTQPAIASPGTRLTGATTAPARVGRRIKANRKPADTSWSNSALLDGSAVTPSIAQSSDPQLAASHRAGMDILTQYDGSREQAGSDQDESDRSDLHPSARHSANTQPSWSTIATGAAEQLGHVDLDHDHDRH